VSTRRYLTASIAAFVVIAVVEFVIHGLLLSGVYQRTASAFRGGGRATALLAVLRRLSHLRVSVHVHLHEGIRA